MRSRIVWSAVLSFAIAGHAHAAQVRVLPDTVWWEPGRGLVRAHCDFRFTHAGPDTLELTDVQVEALDGAGHLLSRRFIGQNGTAPAGSRSKRSSPTRSCSWATTSSSTMGTASTARSATSSAARSP